MSETIDLQQCEHCDKEFPIETMTSMEDCWFCEKCVVDWQDCFDRCEHRWSAEPHHGAMGDVGRVCERCSGFVSDEDAPLLGIEFPAPTT